MSRVTRRQVSPVWLVLMGIASVQLGAAVAKDLFGRIDPTAMVWLRLAFSALVLVTFARPRLRGRSQQDWTTMVAFGVTLGTMNWAFYQAMARIPLGLAVTIEFSGPLVLAAVLSRRARDLLWVALAATGVGLLGFVKTDINVAGIAFALLAATAWAAYILLSAQTGRRWPGLDGLAMASVVAALLLTPFAIPRGDGALKDPEILLLGAMVGLLSSVIPYSVEMNALRRLRPDVFSILMSLEPAAAALAGMLVLQEYLSPVEWLAVACVITASVGATRSRSGVPGGSIGEPVPD
jgi:inner membrane transporter RhtA